MAGFKLHFTCAVDPALPCQHGNESGSEPAAVYRKQEVRAVQKALRLKLQFANRLGRDEIAKIAARAIGEVGRT